MTYIVSSDITGLDIGTARSKAAAFALAAAYDTPARKAAHTKRQTGVDKAAGERAAATKLARKTAQRLIDSDPELSRSGKAAATKRLRSLLVKFPSNISRA